MAVKNSQRFAEIERLMGDYFGCHLAPVMGRVQRDLSNRQADEMRAYSNSTAGILRSLATGKSSVSCPLKPSDSAPLC